MGTSKQMLNKVPEITAFFWIIKVLCTTVGETAADFLNVNLGLGLTGTSVVTGLLLAAALIFQFRSKKYVPVTYWLTVALVSVFGTLVTDNLTDALGVPLETSTIVFAVLLGLTFLAWYMKEKTLSIHSIFTKRREVFYWLAILFTFALGTASGDLMAEGLGLGYLVTGLIVAGAIILISTAWKLRLNSVLSFWLIYILTRPLGASIGDYLSQSPEHGGLGLGATWTSIIFVGGIIGIVLYLTRTKKDVIERVSAEEAIRIDEKGGLLQTVIVIIIFITVGTFGYHARQLSLQNSAPSSGNPSNGSTEQNDSLAIFKTITEDTLKFVEAGDMAGAKNRITDLEFEWDNAAAKLKAVDKARWTEIDDSIDNALSATRAKNPNISSAKTELEELLNILNK